MDKTGPQERSDKTDKMDKTERAVPLAWQGLLVPQVQGGRQVLLDLLV